MDEKVIEVTMFTNQSGTKFNFTNHDGESLGIGIHQIKIVEIVINED